MVTKMNLEGTTRKALVTAIEELTGLKGIYQKSPTYNFDFGEMKVLRDGSIDCPDDWDLIERLKEKGFCPIEENKPMTLTVEIANTLTETELENLVRLIASKGTLISKVVGADCLEIKTDENKLAFPWFTLTKGNQADETAAYTAFITKMTEMVRKQKRITAKEHPVESEKYAMRCFLLRLGFIGDEYRTARKILLRNLTGSAAWRGGVPDDK